MKTLTTRELVLLGVFGAAWGASEISLGAALHAVRMPLTGATLTAVGVLIACVARAYVPRRGSTVFIGAIAALLKLLSIGSVVIGPMLGILAGAIIAEVVLTLFVEPGRLAFVVAGAAAVLWTLIHPFFTGMLLFGLDVADVWTSLISEGSRLLGMDAGRAIVAVVVFMALIRLTIGGVAGWLAWSVVGLLKRRGHLSAYTKGGIDDESESRDGVRDPGRVPVHTGAGRVRRYGERRRPVRSGHGVR